MLPKFGIVNSLLAFALGLIIVTVPVAYAQDWEGSTEITNRELDKCANVNVKAQEIQQKYEPQVNGAKTMKEFENIQARMENELIDVIHSEDISLEEYQQVATAVKQDPQLRKRFQAKVMEKIHQAN